MALSPPPRAFPSPTFPRSLVLLEASRCLQLEPPLSLAHVCLREWGNVSLETWEDPRAVLTAQAHGAKQTHPEVNPPCSASWPLL